MSARLRIRSCLHAFAAGALISGLRAPLGLDWTQLPATNGSSSGQLRGAALLALALSLDASRKTLREGVGALWLLFLTLGFAWHALAAPAWLEPAGRAGFGFLLLVGTLALRSLAGARVGEPVALGRVERVGLVLVGLGAALALETLAHEVRLFTLGTAPEEALVGAVFLGATALGALAFGPLCARLGHEGARTAGGIALAGAASLAGLLFLSTLTPDGLHAYLRRMDALSGPLRALDGHLGGVLALARMPPLDGTSIGLFWATVLLSGASFVLPGFALGATVGSARHVGRLAYALVGAALGLFALPAVVRALAQPLAGDAIAGTSWAWTMLVAAALLAGLGALAVAAAARGRERVLGLALALTAIALPWLRPRLILWSFSPWAAAPIRPELVVPTPAGMVTVERDRDGERIVTLDRKRMTPLHEEQELDQIRILVAWSLLPDDVRARPVRTLFVGQLTPARARALRALGKVELERTSPWHEAGPALEELLFEGEEPPPGVAVTPAEARARLSDDGYDWVLVPPVQGPVLLRRSEAREYWAGADAPRLGRLELGGEALGVAWVLADSSAARELPDEEVLLAMARFESLSIGVVRGRARGDGPGLPTFFPAGAPEGGPGRLELLHTLPLQRSLALEAAWARRLARASEGKPLAEVTRGLALHFAAQKLSSPYETRAQQVELDEEELRAFLAGLPQSGPLDPFQRELWEGLAWLVTEKRLPEEALFLEPVAERFAPWPALDRALGHAYREMLEPETALSFLERALGVERFDAGLLIECARAARELGDRARALAFLERALAIQSDQPEAEKAYGLLLLESGDARGRPILEKLLVRDPDDADLRAALGLPPPPGPDPGEGDGSEGPATDGSGRSGNTIPPPGD